MPFSTFNLQIGWKEIAAGVAIPAVGALVTYFLCGREESNEGVLHSRFCRIELPVPGDKVSAVIGRNGSVVREIERTSGARVRVHALPVTKDGEEEKDGRVVIQGMRENVMDAQIAVRKVIAQTPPVLTELVYVPKSSIGMIIGKKGANIRELCHVSGAKVTIGRTGEDMETVTIRGRPQAIDTAKMWLETKVKTFQDLSDRWDGSEKASVKTAHDEEILPEDEETNVIEGGENTTISFNGGDKIWDN